MPLTCLAVLMLMLGIGDASAQLLRASPSVVIKSGEYAFGSDAAYDPVNRVYLVVMAKELQVAPYGTLVGRFVDPAGSPVGSEFVIEIGWVNLPRAIYSADVVTQTGSGGFIVTWGDFPADTLGGRTVAFPGIVGSSVLSIGAGYGVHEVAYSATSRILGTAWTNHTAPHTTRFSFLPVPHNIAGASTALATGDGGRSPVMWNSVTDLAWHMSRNEFGVLYTKRAAPWALRFARVTTTGSILDDRVITTIDAEPLAVQLGFSPSTGNYIALWANAATGRITAAELTPDGGALMRAELPASILGGQLGMALSYNSVSGTFLLVGFSKVAMSREQIRGVELNSHGAPVSSVIEVTGVPSNATLSAPRAAARADAAEWLVDAESAAGLHYAQIVSTSTVGGGPDIRLGGCFGPDPFTSLGGGTCQNGNWLPPSSPSAPPSTPEPPPSYGDGSCTTPDPFVSLGGGTCVNGDWLPPGATPLPTPPTTPPPPPTSSEGCTGTDPFVALGGGTCYNGDWLPPGMAPSTPSTPPTVPSTTSTSPQPPAESCTGADPFLTLGGGTCYNGDWLPPGMAPPVQPEPAPVPQPPPTPSSGGACTTPDPFGTLPNLIGQCVNGGWVPIEVETFTGVLSRPAELGGAWALATGVAIYQLAESPAAPFATEGLHVSVKAVRLAGIVSVWPVIQVHSIVQTP